MNVDATIEALEQALEQRMQAQLNHSTALFKVALEDKYMEQVKVRRKKTGVTHHTLWCLSIGDASWQQGQKLSFYGHRIKDAVKKAQEYLGLPTKTRNVQPNGQQPQAS